jgi:outer membrane beta-barrel protein
MKNTFIILALTTLAAQAAQAADKKKTEVPAAPAPSEPAGAERVNVDTIKEKYWARGDENEMGVVQNRLYSKERKIETSFGLGLSESDPFLSVKTARLTLGYHFSEYLSAHLVGMRYWSTGSTALTFLENKGGKYNINPLYNYYGLDVKAALIYGKLSVVGKAIIHYDLHIAGGAGFTAGESGKDFTPSIGIGQQFYLAKRTSVFFDYRLKRFTEVELQKAVTVPSQYYQPAGERTKYNNEFTLGVSFLFGGTEQ